MAAYTFGFVLGAYSFGFVLGLIVGIAVTVAHFRHRL